MVAVLWWTETTIKCLSAHDLSGCAQSWEAKLKIGRWQTSSHEARAARCLLAWTTFVLLAVLLTEAAQAQEDAYPVSISCTGWEPLSAVADAGVLIVHYRGAAAAGPCDAQHVEWVRKLGYAVSVLGSPSELGGHHSTEFFLGVPAPLGAKETILVSSGNVAHSSKALRDQESRLDESGSATAGYPNSFRSPSVLPPYSMSSATEDQTSTILAMIREVSPSLLIHHVCKLQDSDLGPYCNEAGTRFSYSPEGLSEAAEYLREQYQAMGLNVSYEPFVFNGTVMTNVVGLLPGVGPDEDHVYILSAHYDSIARNSGQEASSPAPGADDNGSGCSAVVEAARVLSQHRFSRTLRFVHFAGEEQWLRGSAEYARRARERGDLIDGVINLDMIAYESDPPADHIVELHAGEMPDSIAIADVLIAVIAAYDLQLDPQLITSTATWRSDHASFWEQGYPAVLGIEDFDDLNPHYHSTGDTLSNMRPELMVEFSKAAVAAVAQLASMVEDTKPCALYLPLVASFGG